MSQTSDEDINDEHLMANAMSGHEVVAEERQPQTECDRIDDYNNNNEPKNRRASAEEVSQYVKEIHRLSYLLTEKNLVINKLMAALSNQTKEMINLEKAYHALREHCSKTRHR